MSNHSPEAKSSKILREIMSFVLFGFIAILGIAICLKGFAFDTKKVENHFVDYNYVQGVRESTIQYAKDIYQRNGLDSENLEKIFIYDYFKETVDAYFGYQISGSAVYNEDSYLSNINVICSSFEEALDNQLKIQGLDVDSKKIETISNSLNEYIKNAVQVNNISGVKSIINIGSVASSVIIGVCVFFAVSTGLVLFFLGEKRYRSMRAISISFISASFFDLIFAAITVIIFNVKTVDIYPLYLRGQLYSYIYDFVFCVGIAGGILAVISVVFLAVTWKLRKTANNSF